MAGHPHKVKNGFDERTAEQQQAEFLCEYMDTESLATAAANAKISLTKVQKWRMVDENFKEAFEEVVLTLCAKMEDEAYRRGAKGVDEPIYQGGRYVGEKKVYSDTLLMFMMRAKMPDIYREKVHMEKNTTTSNTVLVLPPNGRELSNPTIDSLPILPDKSNIPVSDYLSTEDLKSEKENKNNF